MVRRRLLLAGLAAVLLSAGCVSSTTSGLHHDRTSGSQAVVYFQIPDWHDGFENPVRAGIFAWAASPRVAIYFRRACPPAPANCVPVSTANLANNWAGVAYIGADSAKHLTARFELDRDMVYASPASVQQVACHEAGHALGLDHGQVPGPCDQGKPTAWDLEMIRQSYAHRDACCAPGV